MLQESELSDEEESEEEMMEGENPAHQNQVRVTRLLYCIYVLVSLIV